MEQGTLIKIGKLNRAHGLKGEVRGFIEPSLLPRIKKLHTIFIMMQGKPLPYFVEDLNLDETGGCLFKFEDVNNRTDAEKLAAKEFYIEEKQFKKTVKETGFTYLAGYKLIDPEKGEIGVIENVYEMPAHALAQLMIETKEVLIPLMDETIVKVDKRRKEVTVQISEGLMDIYLK